MNIHRKVPVLGVIKANGLLITGKNFKRPVLNIEKPELRSPAQCFPYRVGFFLFVFPARLQRKPRV